MAVQYTTSPSARKFSHFICESSDPQGSTQRMYGSPITLETARQIMTGYTVIKVNVDGKWVAIDQVQEG